MYDDIVIIGAGQAGFQAAASLRDHDYAGPITLINEEAHAPYQRPPLSKQYLLHKTTDPELYFRPEAWYRARHIDLVGQRAVAVDRVAHQVELGDGRRLRYAHLIFATGARNRVLPVPGHDLDGVYMLRTVQDAKDLRERIRAGSRIVIIGGGFIGLELASVAIQSGAKVTLVEALPRLLARAASPLLSEFILGTHLARGVDVRLGTVVTQIFGSDSSTVRAVETNDREIIDADIVVIGIGVVPNVELAEACGLTVDNGIVVDEELLTNDADISAIGDCARFPNSTGTRIRLESVQNACDQGRCVAAGVVGNRRAYTNVPWFWSQQYDYRLQLAGLSVGYDTLILRGDAKIGAFSVFAYQGTKLLCVESVNRPEDHGAARRFLAVGGPACPPETAADETADLRALSKQTNRENRTALITARE